MIRPGIHGLTGAALAVGVSSVAAATVPDGPSAWIFRLTYILLGVMAAVVLYFLIRSVVASRRTAVSGNAIIQELDVAFKRAALRLSRGRGRASSPGRMPVALLVGPPASAKTTVVTQSGADPELLVGDTHQDGLPLATEVVNLWLARGTLLVEAGSALLADDDAWTRLGEKLRPARLRTALFGRAQASRAALACLPCDLLVDPEGAERVRAEARHLRERIAELAESLGVDLPVYVLFTRSDQIPGFEPFMRNFYSDEVQMPLGATLPLTDIAPEGMESQRARHASSVGAAVDRVYRTLAAVRPTQLVREPDALARGELFEFPVELLKLRDRIINVVLELGRPSGLGTGPLVRGFYFTGVRPVAEDELLAELAATVSDLGRAGGRTVRLDPPRATRMSPTRGSDDSRLRPQWVFLSGLFRRVILSDPAANALTAGGAGVNLVRRTLLGVGLAIAVTTVVGIGTSGVRNARLLGEAHRALAILHAPQPGPVQPTTLAAMDDLVGILQSLEAWGTRPPWSYRWGLYQGRETLERLRPRYFDSFERHLGAPGRQALEASLAQGIEGALSDSTYSRVYEALKAHLVVTAVPDSARRDFLAPAMVNAWAAREPTDSVTRAVLSRQFGYFADKLPTGLPARGSAQGALVAGARAYLRRFEDRDLAYNQLVAQVSRRVPEAAYRDENGVVQADARVPGAFTAAGWKQVHAMLDQGIIPSSEPWVLGVQGGGGEDDSSVAGLQDRYAIAYVRAWQDFLASVSIPRFGGVPTAQRSVERLSGNNSPLLRFLSLASRNTAVDSAAGWQAVRSAFVPLHMLSPPERSDVLASDATRPYLQALGSLSSSLEEAGRETGDAQEGALERVISAAGEVEGEVRMLSLNFPATGVASAVSSGLQVLLATPADHAKDLASSALATGPARALNGEGAQFCSQFAALARSYPFARGASDEVSMDALDAFLNPEQSAFKSFEDALDGVIESQGRGYGPARGAQLRVTPQFLTFFNRIAALSRALYSSGDAPVVEFSVYIEPPPGVSEVEFQVDERVARYTAREVPRERFRWVEGSRVARVSATAAGGQRSLQESGQWAIFRLFEKAQWQDLGRGTRLARWNLSAAVEAEITTSLDVVIFDINTFRGLECTSRVVQ